MATGIRASLEPSQYEFDSQHYIWSAEHQQK